MTRRSETQVGNSKPARPDEANGDALLLRVGEVAALLGCSIRLVWQLKSEGLLPAVRLSPKAVRWRRSVVEQFVETLAEQ